MSDKLARFAAGISYEDIPGQVIEKAKLHLLDALGIGLAATREPYADAVTKTARDWGGNPQSTVWRYGDRAARRSTAAMVNGSYVHGLDFDDTHTDSIYPHERLRGANGAGRGRGCRRERSGYPGGHGGGL